MYIREDTVTITLSTLGAGSGYSSAFNGLFHSVGVSISKAVGASAKVVITGESTDLAILTVANPSTLGARFYPRPTIHNTTGAALPSSEGVMVALANDRVKVVVTSSSGLSAETATVVLTII